MSGGGKIQIGRVEDDRAGGPADLSREGVSAKGAHPSRCEHRLICYSITSVFCAGCGADLA